MGDSIMYPVEAIYQTPPNVWLTSFYGFDPGNWGYLGFSNDSQRRSFIRRSRPGVLVVVYGVGSAAPDELRRVLGVLQCSHRVNDAREFMSPTAWEAKERTAELRGRWELGVKAVRAWRITPEIRPLIARFADETYTLGRAQTIGSQGMPLTQVEALRLLALEMQEVSVFGELPLHQAIPGVGAEVLSPSRPGPVSQQPYVVRESEGPTSIYILIMTGDAGVFLGRAAGNKRIIKVGVSKSPATRRDDHNRALPRGAFGWEIKRCNEWCGLTPFATSRSAIAGETEMKRLFVQRGESLGGEFFLVDEQLIEAVWMSGVETAGAWAAGRRASGCVS